MVCTAKDDTLLKRPLAAKGGVFCLVLAYVLLACIWVVLSDWILALLAGNVFQFNPWHVVEDLLFVLVMAGLLYAILIHRARAQAVHDKTFNIISERAKDGIVLCDRSLRIVYANPAAKKMFGYSAEELLGHPIADFLTEPSAALLTSHVAALDEQQFIQREWNIRHKDGRRVHVEATTQRLPDGNYLAIGTDLTETRQAVEKAKFERLRLRALIRSISDPVWLKDTEGVYTTCNPAFEKLIDLPAERILGRTDGELQRASHIDVLTRTEPNVSLDEMPVTVDQTFYGADGRSAHYEITRYPVFDDYNKLIGVVGIARDVTTAYQSREELAASERRFRTLFDSEREMIYVTDLEARFLNVNQYACNKLGYSRDELLSMRIMDIQSVFTFDELRNLWSSEPFLSGEGITLISCERRKNGSTFPVEVLLNRFEIDNQLLSMAVVRDITEQLTAETVLRASEEFTRAVLDASATQMAVVDKEGTIVAVNDAWTRFARENSEAPIDEHRTGVGSNFFAACRNNEQSDAQASAAIGGVRAVLDGKTERFSMESACLSRQSELWFMMNATPLKLGNGGAVITYVDITSVKQAQQLQARFSRQLQALARMHQDIQEKERHHLSMELHDQIGQALAALNIALASAKQHLDNPVKTRATLDSTLEIVDGITQTTRDIALRLRPPLLDELGIRSALAWHIRNLSLPPTVKVHFEENLDNRRFPEAHELACFRIAQEAITNALRHAAPSEIVVCIRCSSEQISLTIEDDGKGFDCANPADEGDGRISLGLIGIRERVNSLGGQFEISSQPNTGTKVSACLPITAHQA